MASEWSADSVDEWARALGLVGVPLFNSARSLNEIGKHSVLLDGNRGSFVLSVCESDESNQFAKIQSWAWSADVNFSFVVRPHSRIVSMLRWDRRNAIQRFQIEDGAAARTVFDRTLASSRPAAPSAVSKLLTTFRSLRRALLTAATPQQIVRVFNAFLIGANAVRQAKVSPSTWRACRTLNDLFSLLVENRIIATGDVVTLNDPGSFIVGEFADVFLNPDPYTGCVLDPDLLMRHASGRLYQEAHLELEKPVYVQGRMFGIPDGSPEPGLPKRDARYTPPSLARMLAEQAIRAAGSLTTMQAREQLTVLDPACGSGVFLLEAWRELKAKGFSVPTQLIGYDKSAIACEMAQFCISHAVEENAECPHRVELRDSLSVDGWGDPDIILMNPPFSSWNDLDGHERDQIRTLLGKIFHDHVDKSLAFVHAALRSLRPGAVLGCVVPAPMLESRGAYKLRQIIEEDEKLVIFLLGCFRGFDYFVDAVVEPAFIVIGRSSSPVAPAVQVILADDGFEGNAIRQLRRDPEGNDSTQRGFSVFKAARSQFSAASWLPKSRAAGDQLSLLSSRRIPKVGDLFHVRTGTRSGDNKAFVLTERQLEENRIAGSERTWFRPAAGNRTIRSGRILIGSFVFYPYREDGTLALNSEEELASVLPNYFDRVLRPRKESLLARMSLRDRQWWELSEPKTTWQANPQPKIVSAYFGLRGSFAYDASGSYTVTQGFGWLPRKPFHQDDDRAWAYIAILNSKLFQSMLSHFCPTMRGGQYDLSARFIGNAFIPDLINDERIAGETLRELVELGRIIGTGIFPPLDALDHTVCRAMGISFEQWYANEASRQ